MRLVTIALALSVLVAASASAQEFRRRRPVPATAPDTIAKWVHADSNWVRSKSEGTFKANVIYVAFHQTASQADRQGAIEAIGGEVVGGRRWPDGDDGKYYVRIDARRRRGPLEAAIDLLMKMPVVDFAGLIMPVRRKDARRVASAYPMTAEEGTTSRRVPTTAPTTIPTWIFADSNIVADSAQTAAAFYANVIEVWFQPGASQAERQAAIDGVGGEVVGGESLPAGGEGAYFVRIPARRQIDPLRAAARRLRAMPQVDVAAPLYRSAIKLDKATVPPSPPDTIPAWVLADSNFVTTGKTGPFYADVITVEFVPGTPRAKRQAAIDAVGGVVVGGRRDASAEGVYFVRIEANRRLQPLYDACDVLHDMPHVNVAAPIGRVRPARPTD